jgi:hypothetical protein
MDVIEVSILDLGFFYSGSFSKDASLCEMIQEIKDIVGVNEWKCMEFEDTFPEDDLGGKYYDSETIYGISFTPANCDTIWLCFLSNGKISSPEHLELFGYTEDEGKLSALCTMYAYTHIAGQKIHMQVLDLLRYLNKKYFSELDIKDLSNYWTSGDEETMKQTIKVHQEFEDGFQYSEDFPIQPGETEQDFWIRTITYMHGLPKEKKPPDSAAE